MYSILEGVKVIDLTRLLPGALCSMMLADMGAEVLKVEDTSKGDYMRWMKPMVKELSYYFLITNRNKRSIKLNLKEEEGREIFLKLARDYDVVLDGFRPGVMDRLGLGYETLAGVNQKIIYCAISGFGMDGPYRDKVGHDINYIGIAGILNGTGTPDGGAAIPSVQLGDIGVGSMMSVVGVLAGLREQQRTGKGINIDISMLDGLLFYMHLVMAEYFADGKLPVRGDDALTGKFPCYHIYKTKDDRYMAVGNLEDKFWEVMCDVIERPDLIEFQYATGEKRDKVVSELNKIFSQKTMVEWSELFQDRDTCVSQVNDPKDVTEDPHIRHRGIFFEMDHPTEGKIKQIRLPIKFQGLDARADIPAPAYGQHTEEVLRGLGYSVDEINQLAGNGVI